MHCMGIMGIYCTVVLRVYFRNWSDQFDVQFMHKMLNHMMYC